MRGRGAHITEYEGEPFDFSESIERALKQSPKKLTLIDWVVLVLTEAKTPMTVKELAQVIGEHRREYKTGATNGPPTLVNIRYAISDAMNQGLVEYAGQVERVDIMGRPHYPPAYQVD